MANENIKFLYGNAADAPEYSSTEQGRLLFVLDDGELWVDLGGQRVKLYKTAIENASGLGLKAQSDLAELKNFIKTAIGLDPDVSYTKTALKELIEESLLNDSTNASNIQGIRDELSILKGQDSQEGSIKYEIAQALSAALADLDDEYDELGAAAAVLGTSSDTASDDTVYGAKKAAAEALAEAQKKVASVAAGDGIAVDPTTSTAPKVSVKLDPASTDGVASVSEAGLKITIPEGDDYTVSVTTATTATTGMAKTYEIKQKGATVGTIDIPKDLVIKEGSVQTNPDSSHTGKFLVLVLNDENEDKIFINVADLVDTYTAEGSADQVQVAISQSNVISATIVDGSIDNDALADDAVTADKIEDGAVGADELAADAVTTAKIKNGQVTKDKLATDVLNELGKIVWQTFSEAKAQ